MKSDHAFVLYVDMLGFGALTEADRMGLARGTYHAVRFTLDTVGRFSLTKAMFSGAAVVRSPVAGRRNSVA